MYDDDVVHVFDVNVHHTQLRVLVIVAASIRTWCQRNNISQTKT